MADTAAEKRISNFADDHPPSRPGAKTAIISLIVLVGGLVIYYW